MTTQVINPKSDPAKPLSGARSKGFKGAARVPGDKSISHRSLMFGALAIGRTRITGLLEGEDVLGTAEAMRAYGATIEKQGDGSWLVDGLGLFGCREPDRVMDLGNSGTSARLLAGIAAGNPYVSFFTGDGSLTKRPMGRVIEPLSQMGATFFAREGGRLPLGIRGPERLAPLDYYLPVPSAQVKSAVMLAGLYVPGETRIHEREATRDHSENMLRHFGATVEVEPETLEGQGGQTHHQIEGTLVRVAGQPDLIAADVTVPTDPSSAAFPLVAALITPDSEILIESVGLNPTRTGLITTLQEMGGDISIENRRVEGGEPVGDLLVKHSDLKGVTVPPERAPSMIDEYPVLSVAAAFAQGQTLMQGLAELRVKESDRLAAVAAGLKANGITCHETADSLTVEGTAQAVPGGGLVATHLDHRIAMAFLVMGQASLKPVTVDNQEPIQTSFPSFLPLMRALGGGFA